jgi:hemerythrin-like domain-containing protein
MNLRADKILESDHADLNKLQADVQRSIADDDLHRTHEALDLFWGRLALHIRAEHLRLFPALFSVNKSSELAELISLLREDHDFFMTVLGSLMKVFRSASENDAAEVMKFARPELTMLTARLREHNDLEESRIYTLISELDEAEAKHLAAGIKMELNNLPQRFRA